MKKTVEILLALGNPEKGEEGESKNAYADLVDLRKRLGRRQEDQKLAEDLCASIETVASRLGLPLGMDEQPSESVLRKVRLAQVGSEGGKIRPPIEGWEESYPRVGNTYRIFTDTGKVIRTSSLTKIVTGYIQTKNSVYKLEVIETRDH
jgi:hypothetical protein